MAGKRIYITIPEEDYELLNYAGALAKECRGMIARRYVLDRLYHELQASPLLQTYEEGIRARRRERMLRHGR